MFWRKRHQSHAEESSQPQAPRASVESLEGRRLCSASVDPVTGILTVNGTAGNDQLDVTFTPDRVIVGETTPLGTSSRVFYQDTAFNRLLGRRIEPVSRVNMNGLDGNDRLRVYDPTVRCYLYGGNGSDTLLGAVVNNTTTPRLWLDGGAGNDVLTGSVSADTLHGKAGNDILSGGGGDDAIFGWEGHDTLRGDAGNDYLYGDQDNDSLDGGTGSDMLWGGSGVDTVNYGTRTRNLTIRIDGLANDGEFGEADNVGMDIENVIGGRGSDLIVCQAGAVNNVIHGGAGNDTIHAGLGSDHVNAGDGNDFIRVDNRDVDTVIGGLGVDTCIADLVDSVNGCELVVRR